MEAAQGNTQIQIPAARKLTNPLIRDVGFSHTACGLNSLATFFLRAFHVSPEGMWGDESAMERCEMGCDDACCLGTCAPSWQSALCTRGWGGGQLIM